MSSCDSDNVIKVAANNWTQALSHADNGVFSTNTMMCFTHGVETALTFHAGNGDCVGILCSKCYKFFRPGSFAKHAEDCVDALPPSNSMIKKWNDSAHLWANLRRNFGKNGELESETTIWAASRDDNMAYVVHPSWCSSTSRKLRAMCVTDGCAHVCALNGLQRHMKAIHCKGTYNLRILEFHDVVAHVTGKNGDRVTEENESIRGDANNRGDDDAQDGQEDDGEEQEGQGDDDEEQQGQEGDDEEQEGQGDLEVSEEEN